MHFRATTSRLLRAAQIALGAVDVKGIKTLTNVLVKAEGIRVVVSGTNLDCLASDNLPAEVVVPGSILVPARALAHALKSIKEPSTEVLVSDGRCRVGSSLSLPLGSVSEYPQLPFPEPLSTDSGGIPVGPLYQGLKALLPFICTEYLKESLLGVCLRPWGPEGQSGIRMYATDGHRIGRYEVPAPPPRPAPEGATWQNVLGSGITLKTEGVKALLHAIKTTQAYKGNQKVFGSFTDTLAIFSPLETWSVITRYQVKAFPAVESLFRGATKATYSCDRRQLLEAVRQAKKLSGRHPDSSPLTKLVFEDGALRITINNCNTGRFDTTIPVWGSSAPITINFFGPYLFDMANAHQSPDLTIRWAGPGKPLRFSDPDDRHVSLVMPKAG